MSGLEHLRSLEDNFDDEGSIAPTDSTIDRAVSFVPKFKELVRNEKGVSLGEPKYGVGPDGSVDVYWKRKDGYVLLNIPASSRIAPTYSGNFYDNKGNFEEKLGRDAGDHPCRVD